MPARAASRWGTTRPSCRQRTHYHGPPSGHEADALTPDLLRRAAVATVEPNAALGGVSAIERLARWDRFEGEILVVSDRRHDDLPQYRIAFRQVDVDRQLAGVVNIDGVATTAALPSILHAARDLTPHQAANAITSLRYHAGLAVDQVQDELGSGRRIIGSPQLRDALDLIEAGSAGTKSRSEDGMLPAMVLRYGMPLVNVRGAAGLPDYEPDMIWRRRENYCNFAYISAMKRWITVLMLVGARCAKRLTI